MREILFKAKRIDNGEWVEGWLVPTMQNTYHDGYVIIDVRGINYDELDYWEPTFISWKIDADTICQFTGLLDKNGNKIWENDIVRQFSDCSELGHDLYFFYQIKWDEEYARFYGEEIYCKETVLFDELEDIEVIGNVFDNKELSED